MIKIFFVSFIFLVSCISKEERLRKTPILQGHEYKLWKYNDLKGTYFSVRFYFDDHGRAYNLRALKDDRIYEKYNYEDVIVSSTWAINKDTLKCLDGKYIIKKITTDTIFLWDIREQKDYYLSDVGLPPK